MKVRIQEGPIRGTVQAIPSKSQLHRLLICAALSQEETRIVCRRSDAADVNKTIRCLEALGARISWEPEVLRILPLDKARLPDYAAMDCGDSGATLRFMLPLACSLGLRGELQMGERLPERPMKELERQLSKKGCALSRRDWSSLRFAGRLRPGTYQMSGSESSQFLSGLLMVLPGLEKESEIQVSGPIVSRAYVDMTLSVLRQFGIEITERHGTFYIPGGQRYRSPGDMTVEGDWANAAFWLCAGAMPGGDIRCEGLSPESRQAERAIEGILRESGAKVRWENGALLVSSGFRQALHLDASECLDIVPALVPLAAVSEGRSVLRGLDRLRLKESDRLLAIGEILGALGVPLELEDDGDCLRIHGRPRLEGGALPSFTDHRIAMLAAVASTAANGPVTVIGAEAVEKSDPHFWDTLRALGKQVEEQP